MDKSVVSRALKLTRGVESAVLSTFSEEVKGYPFGSVTPFVLTNENQPILLISDIAQHTKNIINNDKCCLTVFTNNTNAQNNFRTTIIGEAHVVEDELVSQKYFNFFPDSKNYFKTHNFSFYVIQPKRVRFIAGFGDIHWIESNDWNNSTPEWKEDELSIIEHMNDDHAQVVELMSKKLFEKEENSSLISLDPQGCHLKIGDQVFYHPFETILNTKDEVRAAFVELAKRLRE